MAEERRGVIERQNIVIVAGRNAWQSMKDTYAKSFLKKRLFGGS